MAALPLTHHALDASAQSKAVPPLESTELANEWVEWTYRWGKLTLVLRTDVGLFSRRLQEPSAKVGGPPSALPGTSLASLERQYFVFTSAPREDHTFDFVETLAAKWGNGHALPIVAAVALENLQRPMPTLIGGKVAAATFENGGVLKNVLTGGVDPDRPGTLRITVHGHEQTFRRAAERFAHASAKAYFDPARNEVGLLLNMDEFDAYYGALERDPKVPAGIVASAFIAYVTDAFNQDSGHELAHLSQKQTDFAGYRLPAISEGEAEVQGMTRQRNGLLFNFLYNTPDAWVNGQFDMDVMTARIRTIGEAGRPMSPWEIDRLVVLQRLIGAGAVPTLRELLAMTPAQFFAGTPEQVEQRYALSWALCLVAIRNDEFRKRLLSAIMARTSGRPDVGAEDRLGAEMTKLVLGLRDLKVSKAKISEDAERFYAVDPIFVGAFYQWLYVADPGDMTTLVYLGDALYAGANYPAAMRLYRAAGKINGASALPLLRIGDVYSRIGRMDTARTLWAQAVATSSLDEGESLYRRMAASRQQ